MSFEYKSDSSSYEMFALVHMDPPQNKTGRFMTLSVMVHAGLLAAAILSVPLVEEAKKETITIEIAEPVRTVSRGLPVPVMTEGAASPIADHDDIVVPATKPVKATKASKAVKAAHVAKATPAKAMAAPKAAATAAPKVATIDDIDAPEIDQAMNEAAQPASASLDNNFAEQDFSQIDDAQEQRVADEKNKLVADAQSVEDENDKALASVSDETREEAKAIDEANRDRRAQDAKAIAAAAQGEREARQRAAAQAAAAAAARKNGMGQKGNGGDAHGTRQTGAPAGSANGVRSLDQLRQMPGNRGPMYSREERRNREQGIVSYLAYVTKDGHLAKFRQVNSTGHAGLDRKTLEALQKWKFYPGQEGWVELPFKWDLKGDPQALDGLLRGRGKDISQL